MSDPISLFSPPSLPVCRPGDDPAAALDADDPAPQASPAPAGKGTTLPAPDHPIAKPAAPPALPIEEQNILAIGGPDALKQYQEGKARMVEVMQAHRVFLATGQIPQTRTPFAWIEILEGKTMSRSERYDAMLRSQGKPIAVSGDVADDDRDPVYLSKQEFKDEFWSREKAEWNQCADEYTRPGKIDKCRREVNEKYGGPAFTAWRDEREARAGAMVRDVAQRIEGVANSGALATAGRLVGGIAGSLSGHDALTWSEYGAAIGGLGDAAAPVVAKKVQDARASAAEADRIGAKSEVTDGYGKGSVRTRSVWASRERGLGVNDCVAATCARSLREGELTNSHEAIGRTGMSPRTVHDMKGLDMAQAKTLFEANGKVLEPAVKNFPADKGDYAVLIYQDGRPKHMVYMRVLGPAPGQTQSRGFYIEDAQMGMRFQGDAARAYLQQRHDILPIKDAK
ncbi:MAG TPA: hypothetical protein VF169_03085 [Albitalea sp.]|uniref:hypothetical protein n=1 Tax=Piscinibacter sp. TaxID=1903157 RepID=UPI002ECFEFEA